jgi:dipeptidyl aminopeptidase/acylaminoacyl peptidase
MSFLEFLFLFFILPLVTCPLWGQVVQKTKLTSESYSQWGEAQLDNISPDGKWAACTMQYQTGSDTLFVMKTSGHKKFGFAKGENAGFSKSNMFFCKSGDHLNILNLSTGKTEIIPNIQNFVYSRETDQLVVLLQSNLLLIKSFKINEILKIDNVVQFSLSKSNSRLACIKTASNKNTVVILDLINIGNQKEVITLPEYFSNLIWQKDGHSLAFMKGVNGQKINGIYHYILESGKLFELSSQMWPDSFKDIPAVYEPDGKILISDDLEKVFFSFSTSKNKAGTKENPIAEVWHTDDPFIYPQQRNKDRFGKDSKLAFWLTFSNQVKIITSDEMSNVMLSGDFNYAVLSDPKVYEPQFEYEGSRDFYVLDLKSFEKKILLKKQPFFPWAFSFSPDGKYMAYFKDDSWWTYNFKTGIHTNITDGTGTEFTAKERSLIPKSICGSAGWTQDNNQIILYDKFDLWAVQADGSLRTRLTKGRESNIIFRIASEPGRQNKNYFFDTPPLEKLNLSKGLILTAKGDDEKTGYYSWNLPDNEKPIVYKCGLIDQLLYSSDKKTFVFREQKFDMSPKLAVKKPTALPVYFFSSNPQQKKYFWGKSELIEYKNSKGIKLKAALFYPAGYDPSKKYPMIVNIYEIKSSELYHYVNPTYYQENGFNTSIMTAEGYFVLFPDISLEYQNPGLSAADCVISAVEKVIALNIIDKEKIGLTGHSFGGYESSFIITQTNIFAAAIASGAITDLVSFYHNINKSTGRPDMWRFKNEQWNMGGTPYNLPDKYYANSPINFVQNIQAPVLLWSGKNDTQVDTSQSIEYYLALRRLGKKANMLLYPDQGHLIINNEQQIDLSLRTLQWFDHFLKDNKQSWINELE